jgi:hypothetical protein
MIQASKTNAEIVKQTIAEMERQPNRPKPNWVRRIRTILNHITTDL